VEGAVLSELGKFAAWILEVAFLAGGLYVAFKRMQKDLNGLGNGMRADKRVEEFRTITMMMTTLVMTEDKNERQWLVDKFLNSFRRP